MQTETIVIENRRPHIIGHSENPGDEKGVGGYPGFRLSPGENDVPVASWAGFLRTAAGKKLTANGYVIERRDRKRATPLVENLAAVSSEDKAVALVEGCKNATLLKTWAKSDGRNRVQKAIGLRLDALMAPEREALSTPERSEQHDDSANARGKPASKG